MVLEILDLGSTASLNDPKFYMNSERFVKRLPSASLWFINETKMLQLIFLDLFSTICKPTSSGWELISIFIIVCVTIFYLRTITLRRGSDFLSFISK